MVTSKEKATHPASSQDATSSAHVVSGSSVHFKLRDGNLSVTVFEKRKGEDVYRFIVPERSYKDSNQKWHSTHIVHEEDLPRLSGLLLATYAQLRHKIQGSD